MFLSNTAVFSLFLHLADIPQPNIHFVHPLNHSALGYSLLAIQKFLSFSCLYPILGLSLYSTLGYHPLRSSNQHQGRVIGIEPYLSTRPDMSMCSCWCLRRGCRFLRCCRGCWGRRCPRRPPRRRSGSIRWGRHTGRSACCRFLCPSPRKYHRSDTSDHRSDKGSSIRNTLQHIP